MSASRQRVNGAIANRLRNHLRHATVVSLFTPPAAASFALVLRGFGVVKFFGRCLVFHRASLVSIRKDQFSMLFQTSELLFLFSNFNHRFCFKLTSKS